MKNHLLSLVVCLLILSFSILHAKEDSLIILLNGTSSAGKTSIAQKLQEKWNGPLWYTGLDAFLISIPRRYDEDGSCAEQGYKFVHGNDNQGRPTCGYKIGPVGRALTHAWHASLKTLSEQGVSMVIDEVLFSEHEFQDYIQQFQGARVYFIAIKPPVEVVEMRERARGDRQIGLARGLYEVTYSNKIYDLEIDSSKMSPEDAANLILTFIKEHPQPTAFQSNRLSF